MNCGVTRARRSRAATPDKIRAIGNSYGGIPTLPRGRRAATRPAQDRVLPPCALCARERQYQAWRGRTNMVAKGLIHNSGMQFARAADKAGHYSRSGKGRECPGAARHSRTLLHDQVNLCSCARAAPHPTRGLSVRPCSSCHHPRMEGPCVHEACTELGHPERYWLLIIFLTRQPYREHRALARLARHRYVAAHHARELAGDGEAQAGAAKARRGRGLGLAEFLKQP